MQPRTLSVLGAGGYAAGVVAASAVLTGVTVAALPPLALPAALGAVGFALGAGVTYRYCSPERVERFQGEAKPALALFAPLLALVVATVGTLAPGFDAGPTFWRAMAGTGLALVGALGVAHAAEWAYAERCERESDTYARLPGKFTHLRSEHGTLVAVGGSVLVLALVASLAALDWDPFFLFVLLYPATEGVSLLRDRDRIVIDAGLREGTAISPWDGFESYEVTDDALVLHQSGWGATTEFPLAHVADLDAAIRALDEHLPRHEE